MNRRLTAFLLTAMTTAVGASTLAQTPPQLTLKEAEAVAVRNHPQLRSAQYSALAANEITREVRSAYFPLAYGSLTGAASDDKSRITAGVLNNPVIYNRYANGLTVGQLITDFGRTQNLVGSAHFRAQAAQQNVEATREDVLLAVDRAYYGALRAQAVLRVAQQTVNERQTVVDQVTALAKSHLKSGLDVSFANVNLAQAKLLLVQAQNDVQSAFATLSAALGYSDQRTFDLVDEPLPTAPIPGLAGLVTEAFQQRPELLGQRDTEQASQKFARAERDLWFPSISAVATTGVTPTGQVPLAGHYAAAGVNVNIPVFNGHLFGARRAEANLRAEAEEQNLRNLEDQVARDVRVAWLEAHTAFQRVDLTQQLLDQANLALDLAQERYKLGLGSIVELSQAQLNQTQAQIEQASARYDYQAQLATLNYQVGILR
ncbi:MAG TPA: TolC family protein [Terriglobia bacterium]|nr:TolC family protein [Terriglobia bacterium]